MRDMPSRRRLRGERPRHHRPQAGRRRTCSKPRSASTRGSSARRSGWPSSTSSRRSRRSTPRSPSCWATRSTGCSVAGPSSSSTPPRARRARTGIDGLLRGGEPHYQREHRMVRADGSVVSVFVDMTHRPGHARRAELLLRAGRDITDRKHAEEALAHQALHDDLTRLPNRLLLVDRLSHSLRARRTDREQRRGALPRPRPLQARERQPRSRRRRRLLVEVAEPLRRRPRVRHRGATRRRRVRDRAARTSQA